MSWLYFEAKRKLEKKLLGFTNQNIEQKNPLTGNPEKRVAGHQSMALAVGLGPPSWG
jgi:hypothetical protein